MTDATCLSGDFIPRSHDEVVGILAAARAQGCAHPIQLSGSVTAHEATTGKVIHRYDTTKDEASGVAYVPCKTRRAAKCPSCAALYQGDAFRLIVDGLRGGEFLDPSVGEHAALFVTFTAPSFGVVHSQRRTSKGGAIAPCRPRRDGELCVHGADLTCDRRHEDGDPLLGQAIASCCFDYRSAVLWNAQAGKLWRQTRNAVNRSLAKATGVSVKKLRSDVCRTQFVKIAEFQARGLVHFHTMIRLDGPNASACAITVETLIAAVKAASADTTVASVDGGRIGWGTQLDIKVIGADTERSALAGYFAKYATKSSDAKGLLHSRIKQEASIERLPINDHLARLVRASWRLADEARRADENKPSRRSFTGGSVRIIKDTERDDWVLTIRGGLAMNRRGHVRRRFATRDHAMAFLRKLEEHPNPLRDLHMDRWAHQFGFGGHFLTKSQTVVTADNVEWPGWSATFKALRDRRRDHNAEVTRQSWQALNPSAELVINTRWEFAGLGYLSPVEAHQAALLAANKTIAKVA